MRWRPAVLAVLLAILAAACGSRLPEDVLARSDALGGAAPADAVPGQDVGAGEQAAPAFDADAPQDVPGTDTGGGGVAPSASAPAASKAAGAAPVAGAPGECRGITTGEKGVSATEIKVASIVTDSGPLPGATEGAYRAASAYAAMVNASGGVCGRKITVLKGDDALDPARARAEFLRLEPQILAFVGQFAVADSGYQDLLKETGVPLIGTSVDPSGRELPNVFPKVEANHVSTAPFVYLRQTYPDVTKVGYLLAAVSGVRVNSPGTEAAIKKVGYDMVYRAEADVTAPDYTAHVIQMRNRGVEFLYLFAFEINMQVRLARNMRQQNWEPPLRMNLIGYNTKWYELMGEAADGWKVPLAYLPVLNPAEPVNSPAVETFLEWNKRVFPTGQIDLFPVNGWASAAYFTEALRRVGAEATRPKLLEALRSVSRVNGGGLLPTTNPVSGETTICFVMVKAEGGKWVREHPTGTGFECGLGERLKYR